MFDSIEAKVAEYVAKLNAAATDMPFRAFRADVGRRYIKIVSYRTDSRSHDSAHAFVDVDGNVFKPEGWTRPARGMRFNVSDIFWVDTCGAYLYRR